MRSSSEVAMSDIEDEAQELASNIDDKIFIALPSGHLDVVLSEDEQSFATAHEEALSESKRQVEYSKPEPLTDSLHHVSVGVQVTDKYDALLELGKKALRGRVQRLSRNVEELLKCSENSSGSFFLLLALIHQSWDPSLALDISNPHRKPASDLARN